MSPYQSIMSALKELAHIEDREDVVEDIDKMMAETGDGEVYDLEPATWDEIADDFDFENSISLNDDETLEEGKKRKPNQLKQMTNFNKRHKKGRGWWVNLNAGDVEKSNAFFNHVMGADGGSQPMAAGGDGGAGMGEALDEGSADDYDFPYTVFKVIAERDYSTDDLRSSEIVMYGEAQDIDQAIEILEEIYNDGYDAIIRDNMSGEFIEQQEIDNYLIQRIGQDDEDDDAEYIPIDNEE